MLATETEWRVLWRVVIQHPSKVIEVGRKLEPLQQTIEVRAPSEAIAVDRVKQHRPKWVVREVSRRPTP